MSPLRDTVFFSCSGPGLSSLKMSSFVRPLAVFPVGSGTCGQRDAATLVQNLAQPKPKPEHATRNTNTTTTKPLRHASLRLGEPGLYTLLGGRDPPPSSLDGRFRRTTDFNFPRMGAPSAILGGFGRFGRALAFILLCVMPGPTAAVVCFHCKDTIPGCAGGDLCPTIVDVSVNAAIFAAPDLTGQSRVVVERVLPHRLLLTFSQRVCDAIIGLATQPAGGRSVDLTTDAFVTESSVVKACFYGHCSPESALLELTSRMTEADEALLPKIKLAIEVIKARGTDVVVGGQGVYSFILAKISQVVEGGDANSYSLQPIETDSSSSSTRLRMTAKMARPTAASRMCEMMHYFVLVVSVLGLCATSVMSDFISRTIYEPMRELGLTFAMAFEFMLSHLDDIERDPTRTTTVGNVVDSGKQDTHLVKAKRNHDVFFRTRAANARPGSADGGDGSVTWNGKSTPAAKKCCAAFNFANNIHARKHLADDGTCMYAHKCNQWVSDKGPRGMCLGDHPKSQCTYDPTKRRDTPLA